MFYVKILCLIQICSWIISDMNLNGREVITDKIKQCMVIDVNDCQFIYKLGSMRGFNSFSHFGIHNKQCAAFNNNNVIQ